MKNIFFLFFSAVCLIPMISHASDAEDAAMALMHAHHAMMEAMQTQSTGVADKDFVQMMIPHHQGAIDMAKVELQYGKDPAIRKLAQDIIAAQEKEIADMKAWQAAHP